MQNSIYRDIADRTKGDIYIGVVGPVRTGKSTFIKRFMDVSVLPNIIDETVKERAVDELPQSADGRTIMTTEPKFIPGNAVQISLADNAQLKVRLIDCVGYIVSGSLGHEENGQPRMIKTPWFEQEIPFNQAAEIGTKKVITEHSTIGVVVTTDGTITEFARNDYIEAEERVVKELKALGKPFVILMNSINPAGEECTKLCAELTEKYQAPIHPVDCANLTEPDINAIFESLLLEFPIEEIGINLPTWIEKLENTHYLKSGIIETILNGSAEVVKLYDVKKLTTAIRSYEHIGTASLEQMDMATGKALIKLDATEGMFYRVLGERTGFEIEDEGSLLSLMQELAVAKKQYDKIAFAMHEVHERGYGIVSPTAEELALEEPEIVKQGGKFGVRLRASAPSIHMIRADIETEVLTYKMKISLEKDKGITNINVEYRFVV